ncbi:amino acid permease [Nocardioides currus]|uniref:Amino acid permease n=1 Tax=Nocardioides currus TaxID=2133958 RepID=A0A2R7Z350_9ACTN|nr:amino acid permease [Nocardioides currus]
MPTPGRALARRIGTTDAVVVGLSAMLGAGVFVAFAPAASAAGSALLVSLGLAALIAFCNATSSAQLAAVHPSSGGTYLFGRVVLGPWWGFVAGWGFVIGKTASCSVMALAFAAYAVPGGGWWQRGAAAAAVALFTAATLRGINRTAQVARVLLGVTGSVLVLVVLLSASREVVEAPDPLTGASTLGVLQAAGLLFFAFAGYARIATLAEEVRRPEQISRAILVALGVTLAVYLAVALVLVRTLGADLASSATPLSDAVGAVGAGWARPAVRVGAAAAALGALLALLVGVSRTTLAMARERDLPAWLASVSDRHRVPDHAQLAVGVAVVVLVLSVDLRGAIGFSSFGVLTYYFVANAAAWRQPAGERRWPQALQLLGMSGCLVLVGTLPGPSVLAGLAVLAVGLLGRLALRRPR